MPIAPAERVVSSAEVKDKNSSKRAFTFAGWDCERGKIRLGLLFRRRCVFAFFIAAYGRLETANALAQAFAQISQLAGTKDEQSDTKNHEQLRHAELANHNRLQYRARLCRPEKPVYAGRYDKSKPPARQSQKRALRPFTATFLRSALSWEKMQNCRCIIVASGCHRQTRELQ
jgi:hypothetical protein